MCDPVTGLMVAGLAISAIGTAASVEGSMNAAKAQDASLQYQANLQDQKAAAATTQGAIDYKSQEQQAAQLEGAQDAGYAGGNVVINTGTPAVVGSQTAGYGTLDALTAQQNDQMSAWGETAQGNVDLMSQINPVNAGISAGIGGTSGIASSLLNYGNSQMATYSAPNNPYDYAPAA